VSLTPIKTIKAESISEKQVSRISKQVSIVNKSFR